MINFNSTDDEYADIFEEELSQTELLLLPQQFIHEILKKSPENSYLEIVGKAPKMSTHEKKAAMSQMEKDAKAARLAKEKAEQLAAVEAAAAAAAAKSKYRASKFETTLILKTNLKSPDETFARFCENMLPHDILHMAMLNKRIYERILQGPFVMPLEVKKFVNFSKLYCDSVCSNGVIEASTLGVGSISALFYMKVEIGPYSYETPFSHEKFSVDADQILSRDRRNYALGLTSSFSSHKMIDSAGLLSLTELFLQHRGGFTLNSLELFFGEYIEEPNVFAFLNALSTPLGYGLECINLEGCNLGPKGLSVLHAVMVRGSLPNLLDLNLDRNGGGELGVKKIRLAVMQGHCPRLRSICIGGNGATNSVIDFFDITIAKKMEHLKHISASTNNIDLSDSTIAPTIAMGFITFRNMMSLDLSCNPLGDGEWVKVMKAAWPMTAAQEKDYLFLSGGNSGGKETKMLNEGVKSDNSYEPIPLKRLVLNQTQIGNRSAAYLAALINMGRLPSLRQLSMGENEMLQSGAEFIIESLPNSSIRVLELQLNGFGNEGLILFVNGAITGLLKGLEYLDVSDVGANSEHCNQLVRTIATLDEISRMKGLRMLRVYGESPYCAAEVRCVLPQAFRDKVYVS